jgi:hypothetical protein
MKRKTGASWVILSEFNEFSCRDYLHGDVADDEFEAACDYEYSRESRVLREAASLHRQDLSFAQIGADINHDFSCGGLFLQSPWFEFFTCAHFPETPWNSLSAGDRREILRTLPLPYGNVQPLPMLDVRRLERVLQNLMERAAKARAEQTARKVLPVLHEGQWTYPLPVIDCSKPKKAHVDAFDAWLELPEMKERLSLYRDSPSGKTGKGKDRLKDLAAWQLFKHLDGNWVKANLFAQKHRKKTDAGEDRPFHAARQGKEKDHQKSEAQLYSEESGFLDAIERARKYLKERMPFEFLLEAQEAALLESQAAIEKAAHGVGVTKEFDVHGEPELAEVSQFEVHL